MSCEQRGVNSARCPLLLLAAILVSDFIMALIPRAVAIGSAYDIIVKWASRTCQSHLPYVLMQRSGTTVVVTRIEFSAFHINHTVVSLCADFHCVLFFF